MISVITVTQLKRFRLLLLLSKCILRQNKKPDEWVIVEGSKTAEDAQMNAVHIHKLKEEFPIPIHYIEFEPNIHLGRLRNKGNMACKGDFIICMDDDDYYPPQRISHVVDRMSAQPNYLIAGCSNLFIHDYNSMQFYQCVGFHTNHSTNSAMAFRKEYLVNHSHDESKTFGEESSFTNNFKEQMIPLNPQHTVVLSSHGSNTFDKRELLKNNPRFTPLSFFVMPKLLNESIYREYYGELKKM